MMHADPLNTRDFTALESLEGALDWWREAGVDADFDLNADGKIDIVAAGRATHNLKIYFNE